MTAFWILAPIMVVAALGLLVVKRAVHAALLLAVVMISLAVLYLGLDAPFLFVVQIIVYTGAILMLFLFVLMLVGVDVEERDAEPVPGHRPLTIIVGLLLAVTLAVGAAQLTLGASLGLDAIHADDAVPGEGGGNAKALADVLFSRWVFAFEATSALLVTAAVGAMVLTHPERGPRVSQAELAARRMRDYAADGLHPGPLPAPGVYARSNSVDVPALLPDGSAAPSSVSRVLAARGDVRSVPGPITALEPAETHVTTEEETEEPWN